MLRPVEVKYRCRVADACNRLALGATQRASAQAGLAARGMCEVCGRGAASSAELSEQQRSEQRSL